MAAGLGCRLSVLAVQVRAGQQAVLRVLVEAKSAVDHKRSAMHAAEQLRLVLGAAGVMVRHVFI